MDTHDSRKLQAQPRQAAHRPGTGTNLAVAGVGGVVPVAAVAGALQNDEVHVRAAEAAATSRAYSLCEHRGWKAPTARPRITYGHNTDVFRKRPKSNPAGTWKAQELESADGEVDRLAPRDGDVRRTCRARVPGHKAVSANLGASVWAYFDLFFDFLLG